MAEARIKLNHIKRVRRVVEGGPHQVRTGREIAFRQEGDEVIIEVDEPIDGGALDIQIVGHREEMAQVDPTEWWKLSEESES